MTNVPAAHALVQRLASSVLDGPSLAGALAAAGNDEVRALLAHVRLGEDRYERVPLHVGSTFEVRLLCWRPGQSSALHAHGSANGAIRVLSGRGVERRLGKPARPLGVESTAEASTWVVEPEVVHQVENDGDAPLVTLHAYSPPLPVDAPSAQAGRSVVIVGGGWSGVAVAVHLLRRGGPDLRVTLVERQGAPGRGVPRPCCPDE
jgi:oxalate decarboxylase/phosphoglucose isomerase-like protein (cupin superfamily)